jgi:Putative transmembrane protein (PGPGW)
MAEWINANLSLLWWVAVLSLAVSLVGMVLAPWWAISLPADYFRHPQRHEPAARRHPRRLMLVLARNLIGMVCILAGLFMLVLPGPGVLAMVCGLMLTDFPAKYRLARWIVTRPPVLHSINWARRKAGKPRLAIDH